MWDVWFHSQVGCSNIEHLSNIDEIKSVESGKAALKEYCKIYLDFIVIQFNKYFRNKEVSKFLLELVIFFFNFSSIKPTFSWSIFHDNSYKSDDLL